MEQFHIVQDLLRAAAPSPVGCAMPVAPMGLCQSAGLTPRTGTEAVTCEGCSAVFTPPVAPEDHVRLTQGHLGRSRALPDRMGMSFSVGCCHSELR